MCYNYKSEALWVIYNMVLSTTTYSDSSRLNSPQKTPTSIANVFGVLVPELPSKEKDDIHLT